ncbi:MAG: 50S ribosomal protein L23 [Coriobacteriales bacterium]|jgi:large subunit ribosomal protein L23|nr:50S ribosomal protein L23 [Coriobacteriales bacterium]
MLAPEQILIRPIVSEKSYDVMTQNKYTFEVAKSAHKIEIAKAVEAVFDVRVLKVNTLTVKPKPKRVRYQLGTTKTWKKAIVTLAPGDTIEAFAA